MKSFQLKRILVATNFSKKSDAAVQLAADLASRANADMLLVHVVEPGLRSKKILTPVADAELKKKAAEKLKETAISILNVYKVKARSRVYGDTFYSGIYRANIYFNADLIVMGHEQVTGQNAAITGSNADRISGYSKVPVLSVGNSDTGVIRVILFPFNEDIRTLQKLEQVKTLAKMYDAVIHIVAFRNSNRALSKSDIYLRTKKVAENVLKEGIWCSTHLMVGKDYAAEISEFAERLHPDLISVVVSPDKGWHKLFAAPSFKNLMSQSSISVLSIPVMQNAKK